MLVAQALAVAGGPGVCAAASILEPSDLELERTREPRNMRNTRNPEGGGFSFAHSARFPGVAPVPVLPRYRSSVCVVTIRDSFGMIGGRGQVVHWLYWLYWFFLLVLGKILRDPGA